MVLSITYQDCKKILIDAVLLRFKLSFGCVKIAFPTRFARRVEFLTCFSLLSNKTAVLIDVNSRIRFSRFGGRKRSLRSY